MTEVMIGNSHKEVVTPRSNQTSLRLIAGLALHVPLFFLNQALGWYRTPEREIRLLFLFGAISAIAVVILMPALKTAKTPRVAGLAIALLILPAMALFNLLIKLLP